MTSTPSGRAEARMQLQAPSHLMTRTRNGREEARAKVKAELTSNGSLSLHHFSVKPHIYIHTHRHTCTHMRCVTITLSFPLSLYVYLFATRLHSLALSLSRRFQHQPKLSFESHSPIFRIPFAPVSDPAPMARLCFESRFPRFRIPGEGQFRIPPCSFESHSSFGSQRCGHVGRA
jgi:hypothetical protein